MFSEVYLYIDLFINEYFDNNTVALLLFLYICFFIYILYLLYSYIYYFVDPEVGYKLIIKRKLQYLLDYITDVVEIYSPLIIYYDMIYWYTEYQLLIIKSLKKQHIRNKKRRFRNRLRGKVLSLFYERQLRLATFAMLIRIGFFLFYYLLIVVKFLFFKLVYSTG